jgi:hypothetical protein
LTSNFLGKTPKVSQRKPVVCAFANPAELCAPGAIQSDLAAPQVQFLKNNSIQRFLYGRCGLFIDMKCRNQLSG